MSGGRPQFVPTKSDRITVTALVACGARQDVIAQHFSIDKKTLRKHFRTEIAQAGVDANAMIAKTLFQKAMSGNLSACIFWLKVRAGWRETSTTEVTGPNGGPLTASLLLGRANGEPISDSAAAASAYAQLTRNPHANIDGITFALPVAVPEATDPEPLKEAQALPVAVAETAFMPASDSPNDIPDNVVDLFTRLGK